jgi:hypothetical protein
LPLKFIKIVQRKLKAPDNARKLIKSHIFPLEKSSRSLSEKKRVKMPETKTNGYSNGNNGHNGYEMEDNASFLFTSESVGEGHPGEQKEHPF